MARATTCAKRMVWRGGRSCLKVTLFLNRKPKWRWRKHGNPDPNWSTTFAKSCSIFSAAATSEIAETIVHQGQGHRRTIAQGIAGGEKAFTRTGQYHRAAHPPTQGLQASSRQEKRQRPRHDGIHLRSGSIRFRFDHQLSRREQPGRICAQMGKTIERLGPPPQTRRDGIATTRCTNR